MGKISLALSLANKKTMKQCSYLKECIEDYDRLKERKEGAISPQTMVWASESRSDGGCTMGDNVTTVGGNDMVLTSGEVDGKGGISVVEFNLDFISVEPTSSEGIELKKSDKVETLMDNALLKDESDEVFVSKLITPKMRLEIKNYESSKIANKDKFPYLKENSLDEMDHDEDHFTLGLDLNMERDCNLIICKLDEGLS